MPVFNVPAIPASINVKSWDKKRELFSKKKPSGMTAAIQAFLDAYKKVDWKPYVEISKYAVSIPTIFGKGGPKVGKELMGMISLMNTYKKAVGSGPVAKLREASLALNKTGKNAAVMFKKENYPKASAAAVEIAADAMFFSGSVNPASLARFFDDSIKALVIKVNIDLKAFIDTVGSLQNIVDKQAVKLKEIAAKKTPQEQAEAYNAVLGDGDAIARHITTAIGLRLEAAAALGVGYPVGKAETLLKALTPFAQTSQRKAVDEKTVKKTLETLATLYNQAKQLPNYPEAFAV